MSRALARISELPVYQYSSVVVDALRPPRLLDTRAHHEE